MIKLLFVLTLSLLFSACSGDKELKNIEPKLVVGKSLADLKLNDQNEVSHSLNADTYKLIFAFAKEPAHVCNDFFATKEPTYLAKHHAQFIADVSSAPSIIRSIFILPGLKDFKHTVLLLDDKVEAVPFRKGVDTEKIILVYIMNKKIQSIKSISTKEALQKALEDDSPMSIMVPMFNEAMDTLSH